MVGPGIWRETLKNVKKVNVQSRTWNMVEKLENHENEKHTLQDLEYGKKTDK